MYFFGTLISKIGDKIYVIAVPWLVYEITKSSIGTGTMFFVETLPFIFISPIAGLVADRFSRRNILIVSAFLQAFLISMIPILYYLHLLQIWQIYILGFLIAGSGACFSVVNGTIIPQLFEKEVLIKANSTFQFMTTSTALFGSALAGILISKIGIYNVLWLDVVSFCPVIASIIFLKFIKDKESKPIKTTSLMQLREGARYIIKHPAIRPLTLLTFIANVANGALISMLVYYARDKLVMSSQQIGWVYAGAAVAQIISILLVPVFAKKGTPIKLMLINMFISALGIILVAFSWDWVSLLIGVAVQSAPVIMFNVYNSTLRQKVVPSYIFGRVSGLCMMISLSTLPLSGFLTGILSDMIDIRYIFFILGLVSVVTVFLYWWSPLRNYVEESGESKAG